MIVYREYTPSHALAPFVECLWTMKAEPALGALGHQLIIPGGRAELVFSLHDQLSLCDDRGTEFLFGPIQMLGPRNRPFHLKCDGEFTLYGARFRRGALPAFLHMPASLFLNQVVPLSAVLGCTASLWSERLSEAAMEQGKVEAVQTLLSLRLQASQEMRQIQRLVSLVTERHDSVKGLCEASGLHYKKMERMLRWYTGYNPKQFCRLMRFYRTLSQMRHDKASLTVIGLENGYYDQAHFVRDFRAFTGLSPSQYGSPQQLIADFTVQGTFV